MGQSDFIPPVSLIESTSHQLAVTRGGVQTCIILLNHVKVLLDGDGNSENDELRLM